MLKRTRLRSRLLIFVAGLILPVALFLGCSNNAPVSQSPAPVEQASSDSPADEDVALATEIGKSIIASCPMAEPGDANAHAACADKLASLELLRDHMSQEIRWGGQKEPELYALRENNTTSFAPLVWRRTYLSTFMFSGEPTVEQKDNLTVLRLPIQFRSDLDPGAFPYPFWHSENKWKAYHQSTELLLIMEDGMIEGAMRSAIKDTERKVVEREWDGKWQWTVANGQQEPKVTLYQNLFSAANPHVNSLDESYRAFEVAMRDHSCEVCHSPSNANEMNPLLILNYPNQALTLRHETVRQIQENLMPPPNGIPDEAERQRLVTLAEAFAKAGDEALAYEGEPVDATAATPSSANHS
ncbi:hypothetical protein IQ268_11280 [Oculatella sp. LEGE 06141]|uniref:hypothetical protein n=1 Tax=Oculatella sp. LEGE 06141 TaxID=1828648 RepID=UPI001880238E|nr:hypothetical protein [Oculatella sp. LEGE 06141]MBE9179142.1 hypothetical protein [Oculatella sp. LEGE 06141]